MKSNGFWAVSVPDEADLITVSDMYGNGDAVLSVSVSGNTVRQQKNGVLLLKFFYRTTVLCMRKSG